MYHRKQTLHSVSCLVRSDKNKNKILEAIGVEFCAYHPHEHTSLPSEGATPQERIQVFSPK